MKLEQHDNVQNRDADRHKKGTSEKTIPRILLVIIVAVVNKDWPLIAAD